MPIWMTVVRRPVRVSGKVARATVELKDNPDLVSYLSCNNVLLDRAVSETRLSRKHIEWRQMEEEEVVQEGMEIEQPGEGEISSIAVHPSDLETSNVQDWEDEWDCIFLDESDMGGVDRDPNQWSQRLEDVLSRDYQAGTSEEAGPQIMISRIDHHYYDHLPLSQQLAQPPQRQSQPQLSSLPPSLMAASNLMSIKVLLKPTMVPRAVQPESTQPSTSQEKTGPDKGKEKAIKEKKPIQQESMEVDDDDQASARVSKGTPLDQPKDRPVHAVLARIPIRPMQLTERTGGRMKPSAYRYCVQFQDGVETNECEWWAFEHLKGNQSFEAARIVFRTSSEALYKADNHCPDLVAGVQILWPRDETEPKDISVYYSILFGIPIVDWVMQETCQEGPIILPTALSEMYYEGFQAVQEKIRLWKEDRTTAVGQLSDDQYAIFLDLAKAPATTIAQNLNSLIDRGQQYSTG